MPLDELLDTVILLRLECLHFNFAALGMPSMPEVIDADLAADIGHQVSLRGLSIASLSGTFNMIHPDREVRELGLARLEPLAEAAGRMGAPLISLCTGTRDPNEKWQRHPDNALPGAWQDLVDGLHRALEVADRHGVVLGIEPEPGNVVDSAAKARHLLDEIDSPRLKIIFDLANLVLGAGVPQMREVADDALALLGPDIAVAHAKDIDQHGCADTVAAGEGALDYDHYLAGLHRIGFDGPLILHSIVREDVAAAATTLRSKLAAIGC